MALPPVQKAVVVVAQKDSRCVFDRPIPAIRPNHILVRVVCVALNPADWRHVDFYPTPGALLGFDYSGIVEDVGEGVTRFKQGDAICGLAHGGNPLQLEDGAFAEYILVKEHVQMYIPTSLGFREAATIGVGMLTIGLALYQYLKLNLPADPVREEDPPFVLVHGGSTASGSLAIQFLKLSGYRVATTCSSHNFDFVKSLGADVVCDYKDPKVADNIRAATGGRVQIALDTIAIEATAKICSDAISADGGTYMALLPVNAPRDDVKSLQVLGYTVFGENFRLHNHNFPAVPADKEFAAEWIQTVGDLLADGSLRVHPPQVCEGGLEGIPDGFSLLREGAVSGKKLVYQVSAVPE